MRPLPHRSGCLLVSLCHIAASAIDPGSSSGSRGHCTAARPASWRAHNRLTRQDHRRLRWNCPNGLYCKPDHFRSNRFRIFPGDPFSIVLVLFSLLIHSLYSLHSALCSLLIHSALCSLLSTLYSVLSALYSLLCAINSVLCTLCSLLSNLPFQISHICPQLLAI